MVIGEKAITFKGIERVTLQLRGKKRHKVKLLLYKTVLLMKP